ncbi:hypothetical protein ACE6H2_011631 [Prunus campanulata]
MGWIKYSKRRQLQGNSGIKDPKLNNALGEKLGLSLGRKSDGPGNPHHSISNANSAWAEWGAEPPLPTSQNPNFATLTPAHWASWQPHQYVTPSTPQTGSGRKQLTGHKDGDRIDPAQASAGSDSEGNRMMVDSVWSSDRTVGKEQRTIKNAKRIRVKKEIRDLGNWVSMIE